jgi:hypothetical protein
MTLKQNSPLKGTQDVVLPNFITACTGRDRRGMIIALILKPTSGVLLILACLAITVKVQNYNLINLA